MSKSDSYDVIDIIEQKVFNQIINRYFLFINIKNKYEKEITIYDLIENFLFYYINDVITVTFRHKKLNFIYYVKNKEMASKKEQTKSKSLVHSALRVLKLPIHC